MGKSKNVSFLRGKRMRATRVDAFGRPVIGNDNAVVTKGFITVAYTTLTEEGEAIVVTNAGGENCVSESATPTFSGFGVEATFCNVDFALFELLTGQTLVKDSTGTVIGITESTDVDISTVNFALELWLGAVGENAASAGSQGEFGYVLTPFLGGGVIGDLSIENAAITFTVTGMTTKNGTGWGAGPYAVELVAGKPALLSTPMRSKDHRRIMHVEVAPPAPFGGSIPVLDPAGTAMTAVTATVTGKAAALAPTPAGTGGVLYDFGDGTWDYAETGAYSKTYAVAGKYTVTAKRGLSTATTVVTIPAA